jgi:hypothetical protein
MTKRYTIEGCKRIWLAIDSKTMHIARYKRKSTRDLDVLLNSNLKIITCEIANRMLNKGITK